jgi:pSer/pThr/pTyr-binding forkhead associated (FHA) protein
VPPEPKTQAPSVTPAAAAPPPEIKPQPQPAATVIARLPGETIFICHPGGWRLEVRDGDILGRTTGPHSGRLGAFPVISGRHARIERQGARWRIADLGSTNKTYVNGAKLEPNTPVQIKKNDVLVLANITFTVEEG